MAGNSLLHMLRGSSTSATQILDPGQPFYNYAKNYLTVGGKDGTTGTNGKPIAARELVGYEGDTDSTIGNNTTELYKVAYEGDALKFLIGGSEQLAISGSGIYASVIDGNFYGSIIVNEDYVDKPYKLRVSSKLFDRGLENYITNCVDSNGYTYGTIYNTIDGGIDSSDYFGFNTSCEVDLELASADTIDLGIHRDCVIEWDMLESDSDFTCLNHKHAYTKGIKYLRMHMQNGVVPSDIFRNQPLAYHEFTSSDLRKLSQGCFYGTFDSTRSKAIKLSRTIEVIDDYALGMDNQLDRNNAKSIYIPNSVDFIGASALPLMDAYSDSNFFTIFRHSPTVVNTTPSGKNIFIVNDDGIKNTLINKMGTYYDDFIYVFEEPLESIIPNDVHTYSNFVSYTVDEEPNNYIINPTQFATGGDWYDGRSFPIDANNYIRCTFLPTDMQNGEVTVTVELSGLYSHAKGSVTLISSNDGEAKITFNLDSDNRTYETVIRDQKFAEAFENRVLWFYKSDTTYYIPARAITFNFKLPSLGIFKGATLDGVEASYKFIKSKLPYDVSSHLKYVFIDGLNISNSDKWYCSTSGTIRLEFDNNITAGTDELLRALFYQAETAMKVVLGDKNDPQK